MFKYEYNYIIFGDMHSNFFEFECGPCDYKGAITFLDLLIISIGVKTGGSRVGGPELCV